ncbi:MAG: ATP-binding protein [Chloroflexota bacterium]
MWHSFRLAARVDAEFAATALDLLVATCRKLVLTTAAAYVAIHMIAIVTWPQVLGWRVWLLAAAVAGMSLLSLELLRRRPIIGVVLWQVGLAAVVLMASLLYRQPLLAGALAVLPLISVVTLGWPFAIGAQGLVAAVLLLSPTFAGGALPAGMVWGILLGGAFAGLAGWAAEETLLTVTQWSLASSRQAEMNMEEARRHRAQLAIALKDLDHAYYRLGRTNAALVAAWKEADEARRFKAEFVANVSHELRTPLNLVIGFSEMMMTAPESYGGVPLPGVYRSDLNAIYHSALHLLALVDDVLDLARIEAGKIALAREEVNVASLVNEAVEIVRNYVLAKGLDLQVEVEPGLPPLSIDRLRIRQVLLNLLVNATRFSDQGFIRIEVSQRGGEMLFRVTDTGRGIPPQDLPKIFQEFRTMEQPVSSWHSGTGLGLPISKKFVELHSGRMGVESTVQQGTTFWFTLPLQPGRTASRQAPRDRMQPLVASATDERVAVLIHDDPQTGPLLQRYLSGCRVAVAPTVEAGMALAEDLQAIAVLTDPSRASSVPETALPVVACPLPSGRQAAAAIGAEDLLVKPVSHQELLQAIDRLQRRVERVLIADDDPNVVRLFRRMLQVRLPPEACLEAYNGEEALSRMRFERPDLVLLDLAMPKVDGRMVLERMAEDPELSHIPVIIVSARSQEYIQLQLPGPVQVIRPGGFRLGEVVQLLEGILKTLAPGWASPGPRALAPPAGLAASLA